MYYLHTLSWVLNLFGIFFVLSAHEHYSIDVFIAFYITTRLFLYYHTLANNRALMQRDRKRTRIYFPLFAFFESKCDGIVPNEYEWPLKTPRSLKTWLDAKDWKKSSWELRKSCWYKARILQDRWGDWCSKFLFFGIERSNCLPVWNSLDKSLSICLISLDKSIHFAYSLVDIWTYTLFLYN